LFSTWALIKITKKKTWALINYYGMKNEPYKKKLNFHYLKKKKKTLDAWSRAVEHTNAAKWRSRTPKCKPTTYQRRKILEGRNGNPITYCSAKEAKEHEILLNHSFSHSKQGHSPQQNREG
jgi:hypothetical protein